LNGVAAERQVVRNDDAGLGSGAFEDGAISLADEPFVSYRPHITAARSETSHHFGADVFIGQKRVLERPHAVIFSSQVCSPLRASAA
jgi:hypothetical protein